MKIISLDRRAALEAVQRACEQLAAERPEIERVILFGSLATGRAGPASDADLLIVLRESDLPFPARIGRYLPEACPIAVDVFPYTREELTGLLAAGSRLVKTALAEGRQIFPPADRLPGGR